MSIAEIFLIFVVALVVVGPKQLPEMLQAASRLWKKIQGLQSQWQHFWREQDKKCVLKDNESRAETADRQYQDPEPKKRMEE